MKKRLSKIKWLWCVLIFLVIMAIPAVPWAADQENCMLCHRYSGLSLFEKDGTERIFYVNEDLYRKSVHGGLLCTSCHPDVKEIPHKEAKLVDCSSDCHVKDPSSEKIFTHKKVVDQYTQSVHGNKKPGLEADYPTCKYCHINPMYSEEGRTLMREQNAESQVLRRCLTCHENRLWTERFYSHFDYRTRQRQSSKDIIFLCSSCHENSEIMTRHGLEPTWTLKDTFHWEAVKYDSPNAPNCVTCHAPAFGEYTVHNITSLKDARSPFAGTEKRLKVCAYEGCHPAATESFVSGKIHSGGLKIEYLKGQEQTAFAAPLLTEEAQAIMMEREKTEQLKSQVIYVINIVYRILIACVVGFMFIHQVLDYVKTRGERKRGGHHA